MKRLIYLFMFLLSASGAYAQAQSLEVSMLDSSQYGTTYLCAQPWSFNPVLYAQGYNGPADSIEFFIAWGDGNTESFFATTWGQVTFYGAYGTASHTYANAGVYTLMVVATAYYNGTPFDTDSLYLPQYLFINNCESVSGQVYLDVANDCSFTGLDYGANAMIEFTNTSTGNVAGYAYAGSGGYYSTALPVGINYTATITNPFGSSSYNCASGPSHSFTLSSAYTHDFALTHNITNFDLNINNPNSIIAINGSGRFLSFNIQELTNSNPQVANVTITIPNGLTPDYCNRAYTLAGNVMTIDPMIVNFTNAWGNNVYVHFGPVNQSLIQMGDQLCFDIHVDPVSGDVNVANNDASVCVTVLNSYDPNDKHVSPTGFGPEGNIASGQTLKYTVNFQNTGNAPAYDIDIVDTLDSDFDLSTFSFDYSSHPCEVIANGNVITFRFNNINLPDSTSNEPASHGFVKYQITVPASATQGTEFTNTAYIYFDFNPPIITNTTLNTIGFAGIDDEPNLASISVYPNPAAENIMIRSTQVVNGRVTIMDMNGRILISQYMPGDAMLMNVGQLDAGVYLVNVHNGQINEIHKLIKR